MDITVVEDLDELRVFHAVEAAALDHNFLALPADPVEEYVPHLDGLPKAGNLVVHFLGRVDGEPVAVATLLMPTLDNHTAVTVSVNVHPAHRRQGHARRLLGFAIQESQRRGRNRIFFEVPHQRDGRDGTALGLMRELGAKPVLDDYRRLLDLSKTPLLPAAPVPEGYRLAQWTDRSPDGLVDGLAYLVGRMVLDAPMGEMDYEQEKWDAARYRESEDTAIARKRTRIVTAAIHEATGQVAGVTEIGLNRERPQVAYQWETIVDPTHRGHGLGLVLKSWNHHLVVQCAPDVTYINTWNAASNSFMIAVNEQLGFQVVERWTEYQLDLQSQSTGSIA